ncbi:MAG: S41 family peptidase [Cyclobacteriaceae bacterium]|nr:PDZ domain-containing protein [Cyclobacteriaceae bacterium]MCH8516592.1 S41 family peptidase [Cyclobacteriaceae bacterium]
MNKFKKISLPLALAVFVLALVSFRSQFADDDKYFQIAKNLDIFATLFKEINSYYVDEVNPSDVMKKGIEGMLESLDPYTNFIPEDDIEDFRTMTTGEYGGIGSLIGNRGGKNMILMPYTDFPAHKAGLRIGDELLEIDGIDVTDKSTPDISKLLKGQANSSFTIKIQRFGEEEPRLIELKREKITVKNVPYYGLINDDVGYIKLSDFTTGAGKEVKNAVIDLKSQGAKSILLDLRDNPGGLLSEAVNVSNVFVPKGSVIVKTKGKVEDWNKTYKALNAPTDLDIPVAVLTSSRSASAAEIVAGVIQDYDRGVLIGQKTFGKGLVQATRPLTYNSQLKVTTAKYYIPSGRCIQAIDYSNRNEDGSVGKVPDSLINSFETLNASRIVYDGGGVDPDIVVNDKSYAPITRSLVGKSLIFDWATEYRQKNESIGDPRKFAISDNDYKNFINWLSDKEYDYTTKVEITIDELIKSARKEKYYDEIKDQIYELKGKMMHNKEQDLITFEEEIRMFIDQEVVSRYYQREGIIQNSFSVDPMVNEATKVLSNQEQYASLLAPNQEVESAYD